MNYKKVYVQIITKVDIDGKYRPMQIEWEDGRKFDITRLYDSRLCPPEQVGGTLTVRYDCLIENRRKTLFREDDTNRWFIEIPMQ